MRCVAHSLHCIVYAGGKCITIYNFFLADGVDRISGLSNDLIQRILHFVLAREIVSTSMLSTRWRSL
uniref:F-box domain-containing protein n=1 Tax=Oryza glumipatula TaxID=40148 RepID=A0A0E0BPW4_9ORYZ